MPNASRNPKADGSNAAMSSQSIPRSQIEESKNEEDVNAGSA